MRSRSCKWSTVGRVLFVAIAWMSGAFLSGCSGSGASDDDDSSNGPADYHVTLLVENSSEPLAGVPIWLGTDGTGDVLTTDASGSVTVTQTEPVLTFSYGYTYSFTSSNVTQEVHRIRTFLNYPLEPENTFYVYDGNKSVGVGTSLSGAIRGITTGGEGYNTDVFLGFGNATSRNVWGKKLGKATQTSYNFEVSFPSPGFIYAAQVLPGTSSSVYSIPVFFDILLNPTGDAPVTLTVSRQFDQHVDLGFQSLDSSVTTSFNDMELVLPGGAGKLFFTDTHHDLNDEESRRISVPELSGPLEGASLNVRAVATSADGTVYQAVMSENVAPGSTAVASMHGIHKVGDYVSLNGSTLAGLSIDLTGDTGSDYELLSYADTATTDSAHYFYSYWTVYQYDASQPLTFATPPSGVYEFPAQGGSGTLTYSSRSASSEVYYGYHDSTPGYALTGVALKTLSTD